MRSENSRRALLYVHRLAVHNPTGVHRYALEIARGLIAAADPDLTVELWSGGQKGDPTFEGVDVHHPWVHRRLLHGSWTLVGAPALERVAGPADVVHLLTPAFPLPSRAPLVVTIHDLIPLNHPSWHAPHERYAFIRSVRHAAEHAARIITPSQVVANDVHELLGVGHDRLRVVPEGVAASFSTPVRQEITDQVCRARDVEPGRYILTVGEISPRKNLQTLFAALSRMSEPATLLVVGARGPQAGDVEGQAAAHGVAGRVRFAGRVDDADLCALMQAARVLVHPALYEGFGLTPVEAMAAGTATVVSSAGSLPEVVGDASLVVDPTDVEGWASALERVCQDDALRADLVGRGRARVAELTWHRAAAATHAVYQEVWT